MEFWVFLRLQDQSMTLNGGEIRERISSITPVVQDGQACYNRRDSAACDGVTA
jgi:hypothetical protein